MNSDIFALRASVSKALERYNYDENESANYSYDSLREEARKQIENASASTRDDQS